MRAAGQRATAALRLAGGRFPFSRTCGTIFKRAVFPEGDAARPITASHLRGAHAVTRTHTGQGGEAGLASLNVHAEDKVRRGFHGASPIRLARAPRYLYAMLLRPE
jgi:hypothetical protein